MLLLRLLLACAPDPQPEAPAEAVFVASEEWKGPALDYPQPDASLGPMACATEDTLRCRADQDCGCGRALSDGACVIGTAACLDLEAPCPELCGPEKGRLTCVDGRCVRAGG